MDSRSTNNIILEEPTKKLKLTKVPHANPYKVTWLNQEQSVIVNGKTWVEISFGSYKDKGFVISCPWMHAIFYWKDHGNLIGR